MRLIDKIYQFVRILPQYVPASVNRLLKDTFLFQLWQKTQFKGKNLVPVQIHFPGGSDCTVQFVKPSYQFKQQAQTGVYEPTLTYELYEIVSENSVFYDIGSYFGYYSQIALCGGVKGQNIFSFEADSTRYKFLEQVHSGDKVNTENAFVGAESDTNMVKLDTFCSTNPPPTVMKIDVEGDEFDVLEGGKKILQNHQPTLYVEMHPQVYPQMGTSVEEIVQMLVSNGYTIQMADHRRDDRWRTVKIQDLPKFDPSVEEENTPENTYLLKAIAP